MAQYKEGQGQFNNSNEGVKPSYEDIDQALFDYKITTQEANDLKGLPWNSSSRYWGNQKKFIRDVHRNAGLDVSGKDW